MMHGPYWGLGWGMTIWPLIIILVVYLINRDASRKRPSGDSAIEILKKRYAKGEITLEQFQQMKKDLLI